MATKNSINLSTHQSVLKCWNRTYRWIDPISFKTCPLDALQRIVRQFDRLARRYPGAARELTAFGFGSTVARSGVNAGVRGLSVTQGPERRMLFDQIYFSCAGVNSTYKLLRFNEADGLSPRGCDGVEYPVSHEFGHLLMADYIFNPGTRRRALRWFLEMQDYRGEDISDLAASNPLEQFADMFAVTEHWDINHLDSVPSLVAFQRFLREVEVDRRNPTDTDAAIWCGHRVEWGVYELNALTGELIYPDEWWLLAKGA